MHKIDNPTFPPRRARALLPLIVLTMYGILAGLVSLPVPAHAAPDKVVYELSKECSASASEYFAKGHHGNTFAEYVTNGQDSDNSWFENHYNPSLNACFMLEINDHYYAVWHHFVRSWSLINVNDNREIDDANCDWGDPGKLVSEDACSRNDPVLFGKLHPEAKDFGDEVARYMERSVQGEASK